MEKKLPSAAEKIRWAQNNFKRLTKEKRRRKRLSMAVNLLVLDAMMEAEGDKAILPGEIATDWLALYEAQRQENPGRPANGESTT